MNQIAARFSDSLKEAIRDANQTQTEVAAKVGISYSSLRKIISGEREPSRPVRTLLIQRFPALADIDATPAAVQ